MRREAAGLLSTGATLQVILEEFGKWLNASVNATMAERNRYFGVVFNESNRLILAGSNLKVDERVEGTSCLGSLEGWFWKY